MSKINRICSAYIQLNKAELEGFNVEMKNEDNASINKSNQDSWKSLYILKSDTSERLITTTFFFQDLMVPSR